MYKEKFKKKKPEKVLRLKRHLKKKAQNNNEAKNKEKAEKDIVVEEMGLSFHSGACKRPSLSLTGAVRPWRCNMNKYGNILSEMSNIDS